MYSSAWPSSSGFVLEIVQGVVGGMLKCACVCAMFRTEFQFLERGETPKFGVALNN